MEILVHGMELYLWNNEDDTFNESGGEFKMVLTVRKEGNTWQIITKQTVSPFRKWKRLLGALIPSTTSFEFNTKNGSKNQIRSGNLI